MSAFNMEEQYQQYLHPDPSESDFSDSIPSAIRSVKGAGSARTNKAKNRTPVKILQINKNSALNKKLLSFFNTGLDKLNATGYIFDWILVYPEEIDLYEEQGIKSFPVMLIDEKKITGTNAIIDFFGGAKCKKVRFAANTKISKNDDDMVRNYLLNELDNKDDDGMDDDEVFANTVTQRINAMNKARGAGGQHTISMSNPEIHERSARSASRHNNFDFEKRPTKNQNLSDSGAGSVDSAANILRKTTSAKGDLDDDLMLKFWQNQEETEI